MKSLALSATAAIGLLFGLAAASLHTGVTTSERWSARSQAESDPAAAQNRSGGWMGGLWGQGRTRWISGKDRRPAKAAKEGEAATQPPSMLQGERAEGLGRDAGVQRRHARIGDATGSISRPSALRAALRQSIVKDRVRRVGGLAGPLKVGAIVPPTIHLRPLPASVVSLNPAWRGHEFFVFGKEIVVVQPKTSKIADLVQYTE